MRRGGPTLDIVMPRAGSRASSGSTEEFAARHKTGGLALRDMQKRPTRFRPLVLETTVLRKLTDDQLQMVVGGLFSEASCAEQGCERRRV